MAVTSGRPQRTDAARNADRILRAARTAYAELGPDASVEAIAKAAGVGERTLYRHFPSKAALIRAALDQSIEENLIPVIDDALTDPDPLHGLVRLIEAATGLGARQHSILRAARQAGALADISERLDSALAELTVRAQQAGLVRADLMAEDLPRIVAMLNSVLWTMDPTGDGWRRYVALIVDAISTAAHRELPPIVPLQQGATLDSWPI